MLFGTVLLFLGLIIGSFLNVVILRRSAHTLGGRSVCLSCGAQLAWYDMIPVVSWLILAGRCRGCGSRISAQYPLVEASTALTFLIIGSSSLLYAPALLILSLIVAALLIIIAAYDMRHTIIPDSWVYVFALVALVYALMNGVPPDSSLWIVLAAGPIAAAPISALWLISRGAWIGLGDAKLSLGMGWLLGIVYGVGAVFFAFVIGALISVCILIPLPYVKALIRARGIARFNRASRHLTMKSEVPFGPFLVLSCFIVWFALLYHLPLPW